MIEILAARFEFVAAILVLGIGLYLTVADRGLVKKVIGLNLFQTAVFLFFIVASLKEGGQAPLLTADGGPYVNPLPHVIVLTAIVVGVSLTAAALALLIRIHDAYGALREDVIEELIEDG